MKVESLIDLLSTIHEVQFCRTSHENGVHTSVYQGRNGNPVLIDTTDEDIEAPIVKGYFKELGVDDWYFDFIPED